MLFIDNKYTRLYFLIIEKARMRILPVGEYRERHHIIPRSLGGDDSRNNLVELTAKEHLICHKLLVKMTKGVDRGKMSFAVVLMCGKKGSRVHSSIKKFLAERMSELHSGRVPVTDGIIDKFVFKNQPIPEGFYRGFSPATVKKHGAGNKGKKWITNGEISYQIKTNILPEGFYHGQAENHKKKNSNALRGKGNPMFGKTGSDHPSFGYRHTEEMKKHLAETNTGIKNGMYGRTPVNAIKLTINGKEYKSMKEARKDTGLTRTAIEKIVKGIRDRDRAVGGETI
jgi:hypothetical protein